MMAALSDTKVSVEVRRIGETLPTASYRELPDLSRLLLKLADLAQAQELELQLLRDMEAGCDMRTAIRDAIGEQLAAPADDGGNVIFSKFGRKAP